MTYIEDLKTGNIQHTDEGMTPETGFKSFITLANDKLEHTVKQSLGHGTDGVVALVNVHTLGHKFGTDFDLGLGDGHVQVIHVRAHKIRNSFSSLKGNTVNWEIEVCKHVSKAYNSFIFYHY